MEPRDSVELPKGPIDRLIKPIERFMHVEAASGVVLLLCAVAALVVANSAWSGAYLAFWKTKVGIQIGSFEMMHPLYHWVNDGLMAIFFFVVGLEVKREVAIGELRDIRRAALPVAAAIGGMIVPAGIYLALQWGKPAQNGWGIPMATDIAFVVGCMAVLGSRLPHSFRVLILSLAIADDVGAILVIAIGYTESLDYTALLLGFAGLALVWLLLRLGVRHLLVFGILAVLVWVAFHESGVHATIAGVLLGLMAPTRVEVSESLFGRVLHRATDVFHGGGWSDEAHRAQKVNLMKRFTRETISKVEYLEGTLHPWVGFLIMPIFALANAGVPFSLADLTNPVAIAVAAGLLVGKPVGIVLLSWLAVKAGVARLPDGVNWGMVAGGGVLAGMGFAMALFIAGLALDASVLDYAKVGILTGSLIAAVLGMTLLITFARPDATSTAESQPVN